MTDQLAVPPRVTNHASECGLGRLSTASAGNSTWLDVGIGVVAGVGAIATLGMLNFLDVRAGLVRAALVLVIVVAPFWIVARLVAGTERTYLFEGGVVKATKFRMRTLAWPEVEALEVVLPAEGSYIEDAGPLSYTLRARGGQAISFQSGDAKTLGELLLQQVADAGLPVSYTTFGRGSK